MSNETSITGRRAHYAAVRSVLWRVLLANLAVTVVKIALGLSTGALAVVADGFHSLVDTSSNLIGLAAIRLASRPADERYPYGYRRFETIGALAIGVMLLGAAWEIGQAIVQRILTQSVPEIHPLTLWLFSLTLPVNLGIVLLETRAGRRLKSEILLADATHTRTDLLVTLSVIVSLIGVWLGWPWLDWLVASVVVLLILRAAFSILRETTSWLGDVVIADPGQVESIARGVPGVLHVHRVRSRGTPDAGFVDLHVKVPPGMSTSQSHAVASEVENRLKAQLSNVVDALVHIEPGRHDGVSEWERIAYDMRQIADEMGLGLHDLHVHTAPETGYAIELHLEMRGDLSLGEAHELAEQFERRVQARWPNATSVITHLEPLPNAVLSPEAQVDGDLEARVREFLVETVGEDGLLDLGLRRSGGHNSLAVRMRLPAALSLQEAHNRAEDLERQLITHFPALSRVTVHVEPRREPDGARPSSDT